MKSQLLHLGIYLFILGGGFCLFFLPRKKGGVCVCVWSGIVEVSPLNKGMHASCSVCF